jgi:hypothetical protein
MATTDQGRYSAVLNRVRPGSMGKAAPYVIGGLAAAAGAGWLWANRGEAGVIERTRQRLTRSRDATPNASDIRIDRHRRDRGRT